MRVPIPIANGFYVSESKTISNQRCINYRPNISQAQGAISPANLFGCEGLTQKVTTGTINQINRGAHVKNGKPYFVNGESIYRLNRSVSSDGVVTVNIVEIGDIPGDARVSMADNGTQLIVIAPDGTGYIINEAADPVFEQITAPGFTANGTPQSVSFINGFFICTTDSKKFIRSDANDGLTWNSLNFGTAEADPDDITAQIVFKNDLFIAGSETIESFQGVATAGLGFQRNEGFIIDKGVCAKHTLIKASDTFMFIGCGTNESPSIWAFSGSSTPAKVSTTAIDTILNDITAEELSEAFAYSFARKGAFIVGFTFANYTFEYNTITGRWNERSSELINSKGNAVSLRWRANSVVSAYGSIWCGDSQDGRIGVLEDNHTEVTNTDKKVILEASKDGKKFGNKLTRSIGNIGNFSRKVIWRQLGRFSRMASFNFTASGFNNEYGNVIIGKFSIQPLFDKGNTLIISSLELGVESGTSQPAIIDLHAQMRSSNTGG